MGFRQPTHTEFSVAGLRRFLGRHGLVVGVDDVDPHAATVGQCRDQGAERLRRATGTTDNATEVIGVHAHLEYITARRSLGRDDDLVRVIDDALDQVFECWG
jgi:hypothetical protein